MPGPRPVPAPAGDPALDDLLVAAAHGDVGALAALYDGTAPLVFGLLRGVLGDATRAEQATERVYLRLWCTAPQLDLAGTCALSQLLSATRHELAGDPPTGERSPS